MWFGISSIHRDLPKRGSCSMHAKCLRDLECRRDVHGNPRDRTCRGVTVAKFMNGRAE